MINAESAGIDDNAVNGESVAALSLDNGAKTLAIGYRLFRVSIKRLRIDIRPRGVEVWLPLDSP